MATLSTLPTSKNNKDHKMRENFQHFILEEDHPCVMAQSVFAQDHADFHVYEELGTKASAEKIIQDLKLYISKYDFESNDFFSFIAGFKTENELSEVDFEKLLWKQLQLLHEADDQEWDPEVSSNPEDEDFSFSLAGRAFYVIGMHPNSSRKARQTPFPTIVFNLHWQFEKLREMGAFHNVRDKIRQRDIELQGNINPMMEDFGENSEARQYSGREVGEEWKCPFHNSK